MSDIENGGPAFPKTGRVSSENRRIEDGQVGMTLRDYFAAKALQGFITGIDSFNEDAVTAASYRLADAMLRARSQS